jgi:hypothetical protein
MGTNQMTLPYNADDPQFFAKILQSKKERFVQLCVKWDSAEDLASDLAEIGYEVSPRTVTNWRNRSFKRVPYAAVQAVKYAIEIKRQRQAEMWAASLKEAQAL